MFHGTNIYSAGGEVVCRSKNLRGLLAYARKSKPLKIEAHLNPDNSSGVFWVHYADGAWTSVNFTSYHIMVDWIRNRRMFKGVECVLQGPDMGYLTFPGVIAGSVQ